MASLAWPTSLTKLWAALARFLCSAPAALARANHKQEEAEEEEEAAIDYLALRWPPARTRRGSIASVGSMLLLLLLPLLLRPFRLSLFGQSQLVSRKLFGRHVDDDHQHHLCAASAASAAAAASRPWQVEQNQQLAPLMQDDEDLRETTACSSFEFQLARCSRPIELVIQQLQWQSHRFIS